MSEILAATGGDLKQLEEILNAESIKALSGFSPLYLEAEKKRKGSGRGALMAEFEKFAGAKIDPADFEKRYQSRLSDTDVQMTEAAKEFNYAVGSQLLPELTKAIPAFRDMIPAITDMTKHAIGFAKWVGENPGTGAMTVVSALLAKEIASAGVSALVSAGMEKLMTALALKIGGAAGVPPVPLGGAGGAAGAALGGGAAATLGLGAAAVGIGGFVAYKLATMDQAEPESDIKGRAVARERDERWSMSKDIQQAQNQALADKYAGGDVAKLRGIVSQDIKGAAQGKAPVIDPASMQALADKVAEAVRSSAGAAKVSRNDPILAR